MGHRIVFSTPDDFVQKGLIENADVEIRNARWELSDYNGKSSTTVLALYCDLHEIMKDGTVSDIPSGDSTFWSAGNPNGIEIVEEGRYIESSHEGGSLAKGSNFHMFYETLCKQGLKGILGDAHALNGVQFHCVRVPAPERTGGNFEPSGDGKKNNKILIASSLLFDPNTAGKDKATTSKPTAKATGTTAAKPTAAATPVIDNATRATALEWATSISETVTNGMEVTTFRANVIRVGIKNKIDGAIRTAVSALLANPEELEKVTLELGFAVEEGKLVG
jgi:hypothetical protein